MEKSYKLILSLLFLLMFVVLSLQLYHSIDAYNTNKKTISNLITTIFDNSVEEYYLDFPNSKDMQDIIKNQIETYIKEQDSFFFSKANPMGKKKKLVSDKNKYYPNEKDTIFNQVNEHFLMGGYSFIHSNTVVYQPKTNKNIKKIDELQNKTSPPFYDKNFAAAQNQIKKIIFKEYNKYKIKNIDLENLYDKIKKKLDRSQITLNYGLFFTTLNEMGDNGEEIVYERFNVNNVGDNYLMIASNSSFLSMDDISLVMIFDNPIISVLRKSFWEIGVSLFFSGLIISCLFIFFNFIKKQKRIDEIRNDLISNITHELKTPISTAVVAIEGVQYFNANRDQKKQQEYLDVSKNQMNKLSTMVDKILDSATLNSDRVKLDFKYVDFKIFLEEIIQKFKLTNSKNVSVIESDLEILSKVMLSIDTFHMENALQNILENAIKYGAKVIRLVAKIKNDEVILQFEDDGIGIKPMYANKIFHQFYRVPTGNKHDTKGFGIGLYYTKNIIERHGGKIILDTMKTKKTVFVITLKK